jgi:toxin ParE1/3/4
VRRRILFRPAADRDLEEQAEHLARNARLEAAVSFYAAVEETLGLIATQPRLGTLRRLRNPLLVGVRMCVVKGFEKHLIFCRQIEAGVEVLRVLHGARDMERLFE